MNIKRAAGITFALFIAVTSQSIFRLCHNSVSWHFFERIPYFRSKTEAK